MNYSNINARFVWAYDIETAGNDTAPKFHAKFAAEIKAPSTWKDEEKIAAHVAKKKAELSSKDALSWFTGKIVSIAFTNVEDIMDKVKKPRSVAFCGFDEAAVLKLACDFVNDQTNGVLQLVGKSNTGFDDGFLTGRLMVHRLPIPAIMRNSYNMLDVDKMICSGYGTNQTGKLNHYAFALGMNPKIMDGAMVPKLYKEAFAAKIAGDMDKVKEIMVRIKDYNIDDTVITAEIAGRLLMSQV